MISRARVAAILLTFLAINLLAGASPARADYVPISGAGSTWSQNALDQWIRNVQQNGIKVNFAGTGSSDGRNQFKNGTVDFAVSEIPYGLSDGGVVDQPPTRPYAYMPVVAGGTALMYNLKIGNSRVTNLRLSGEVIAKIFAGQITSWDDPAIKADNPGLALPARSVVPVVRSDGSGTTAQFTTWMSKQHPGIWDSYCARAGRATPCGVTSNYPVVNGSGFVAQAGSTGVAGYVKQGASEGAITYVEYSYALNANFPVAKVLNNAGYYIEPTARAVAVGLLGAQINNDPNSSEYLTQKLDGVYNNADPRSYPLSSYSYMIMPNAEGGTFNQAKGQTLGDFAYYFLCEGQQQAEVLGYSPLPINLVQAGFEEVRKIPGVSAQNINVAGCNNPTFSPTGENTLAITAPQPAECDKQGPAQCTTGTAGAKEETPVSNSQQEESGGQTGTSSGSSSSTTQGSSSSTQSAAAADPAATAAAVDAAATSGEALVVDPDTGEVLSGDPISSGATLVAAVPVSLTAPSGWGTQQTLILLGGLLLLALVVGPPLLARHLSERSPR